MSDLKNLSFEKIDEYLTSLLPARDPILESMELYGRERGFPFIGPLVGTVLSIFAQAIGAKRILELGSGFGYSAMHFAKAIPDNGLVICTDGDPENAKRAAKYFHDAGLMHKLEFHVGDAVSVMDTLSGEFDVILMDIDKEGYPDAFLRAWPRLRTGGLFIADNLLWDGRIFGSDDSPSTRGIKEFTRLVYSTPDAKTTLLPLRDGISVSLKSA